MPLRQVICGCEHPCRHKHTARLIPRQTYKLVHTNHTRTVGYLLINKFHNILWPSTAGLGSVIIDSQPLTVAVLAALLFGEKLGAVNISGLFVGVAGLLLLEVPEDALSQISGESVSQGCCPCLCLSLKPWRSAHAGVASGEHIFHLGPSWETSKYTTAVHVILLHTCCTPWTTLCVA